MSIGFILNLYKNKKNIEENKRYIKIIESIKLYRFNNLVSVFLPYDKDQKNFPVQSSFILDDKAMVLKNPQRIEMKDTPIVVKDKLFLLINQQVVNGTVKIEGPKMPICFSMIPGDARHYIEKIEAKNITLDALYKGFLAKDVEPKKLFVIGKIVCKNFYGSGILHSENKNKDNKKENLVITNCVIYKPEGTIKDYSKTKCIFSIKRGSHVFYMEFDGCKKVKDISAYEYSLFLAKTGCVDSILEHYQFLSKTLKYAGPLDDMLFTGIDALRMSNNSKASNERCFKIFRHIVKDAMISKQERTQSLWQKHKGKLSFAAVIGVLCIASGFLLSS